MSDKVPDDLIGIEEASRLVFRKPPTLREWSRRGFAFNGMRVTEYRDRFTNNRFYSRSEIMRIRERIVFRVVPAEQNAS